MRIPIDILKDRLAAQLDVIEILDLLGITERELLDYLDDRIEESEEECLDALR